MNAAPAAGRAGGPPAAPATPAGQAAPTRRPLTGNQIDEQLNAFFAANGVLVRITDAGRDHGQIRAFHNRTYDETKAPPIVVMRNEDYGRIWRLLEDKRQVELEFDIVNRSFPEGRTSYNVIAEIPGTDKADELVMLGGHLDSWHAATGATDNAIGCAVMMEAVRILQAIGARPRRTIRVALWSGEEQGLLGSRDYANRYLGTVQNQDGKSVVTPGPEHERHSAYFNIDNGTGKIRGIWLQQNEAVRPIFAEWIKPLKDLGVEILGPRSVSSTDHTNIDRLGVPGFQFVQERYEYNSRTHHSNMDVYDRVQVDDMKQMATVAAVFAWQAATRDQKLPRKQ
jgi:Zn-dependent M28 family amino/carboxypeptidase